LIFLEENDSLTEVRKGFEGYWHANRKPTINVL